MNLSDQHHFLFTLYLGNQSTGKEGGIADVDAMILNEINKDNECLCH
jgi:hypothetical protein